MHESGEIVVQCCVPADVGQLRRVQLFKRGPSAVRDGK
jgi:hypothetical protein